MIKSDRWIDEQNGMIDPFIPSLTRETHLGEFMPHDEVPSACRNRKNSWVRSISYGLSSYGYDLRLSPKEFKIFRHIPGTVINPKHFNSGNLESVKLHSDEDGEYFILPAHSYGLGVTLERVAMPANVTGLLLNKSTYVRCGVLLPATVIEAGWKGHITLEISNSSNADVRIFALEGIAQLLFFEGDDCATNYDERDGKYMDQPELIVTAKV
jgi:dCTP deaminase